MLLLSGEPPSERALLAVKIADHVHYGVRTGSALVFPAQLTGVPASWQVSSIIYRPADAVLRPSNYVC